MIEPIVSAAVLATTLLALAVLVHAVMADARDRRLDPLAWGMLAAFGLALVLCPAPGPFMTTPPSSAGRGS